MADDLKAGADAGGDKGGAAAGADAGKAAAGTIIDTGAGKDGGTVLADKAAAGGADKSAVGADKGAADGGAGAADKGSADKGSAQPDWRARLAGEDKEFVKVLARYTDEAAFGKAHRALLARMSSGELKKGLAEGATPEEVATWRAENGIPKDEAGYIEKMSLPNGLVLGEADKPIVAEFAKAALAKNVSPDAFNGLVAQYYAIQDQQRAKQEEADATFKQEADDALRGAWKGNDYRQNLTAIQNLMAGWPEGLAVRVLAGRTADGRKLGDDPAFVQQMASLAREINPMAALVPVGTTDAGKNVADELASIRKFRTEKPNEYEADKKMQAREIELIDADLKMKRRTAA